MASPSLQSRRRPQERTEDLGRQLDLSHNPGGGLRPSPPSESDPARQTRSLSRSLERSRASVWNAHDGVRNAMRGPLGQSFDRLERSSSAQREQHDGWNGNPSHHRQPHPALMHEHDGIRDWPRQNVAMHEIQRKRDAPQKPRPPRLERPLQPRADQHSRKKQRRDHRLKLIPGSRAGPPKPRRNRSPRPDRASVQRPPPTPTDRSRPAARPRKIARRADRPPARVRCPNPTPRGGWPDNCRTTPNSTAR